MNPEHDGRNGEVDSDEHGAWEIRSNADESVGLKEEVEEETLVEMLEDIVQTPEQTLRDSPQGHLVVPSVANGLERNGVDMIRNEARMRTGNVTKSLVQHAPQQASNAATPHLHYLIGVRRLDARGFSTVVKALSGDKARDLFIDIWSEVEASG